MVGYPEDVLAAGAIGGQAPGAHPLSGHAPGRRSAASGCARTATQLQMDLRGAFALGDVNRVAESYHWVGISSDQARTTMDRLQQLTNHPVLDTRYYNAGIGAGSLLASASGAPGGGGILHLLLEPSLDASAVAKARTMPTPPARAISTSPPSKAAVATPDDGI